MDYGKNRRPFGFKDKFSYMMGDVGCNLVLQLANSYLIIFYTKVMGVSAVIVGTIFMLARFVDAFTDMAVGRIVDTRSDKNGDRFRPWMAYASIPLVISSTMMYNYLLADASQSIKIIWLVVTYLLFGSVFYTAINIPYGAMSTVITDKPDQRASLSTWRSVGSQIAGVILGIAIPLLIYVKDADGNSIASGSRFFVVSAGLGILALFSILYSWKGSIERIRIIDKKKVKGDDFKVITKIFRSKTLMTYFMTMVFVYASVTVFLAFNQYMFLDYFGNTGLSGFASLVMFVATVLTAPIAVPLSKKYGKKEVATFGLLLSSVAYVIMWVLRVTNPIHYFIGIFFAFFGLGMISMLGNAINNDCVESHYLETGDRADGTIYAMNSFMRKMAGAISTGIGGWALGWIRYDGLAAVQTEAVRQSLFNITMGIMTICFALSFVFLYLFPLNKKVVEEIQVELANNKPLGQ